MKRVITAIFFLWIAVVTTGARATKTEMPEFLQITHWFNTDEPLSKKDFSGKVLLIDFWNYSNLKSLRRIEILNQWYLRYRFEGLRIVGVLSPELAFEKDPLQLIEILKRYKMEYPVAFDGEFSLRRAYDLPNSSAAVLINGDGRIEEVMSEINYDQTERSLQELIRRANPEASLPTDEKIQIPTYESFPDFNFGYKNFSGYGNEKRFTAGTVQSYSLPLQIFHGRFYLSGTWSSKEESLELSGTPGSLTLLHSTRHVHLAGASLAGTALPAEVRLNGLPLEKDVKGRDIILQGGKSYLFLEQARFYEILAQPVKSGVYKLEILFEEPGAEIFKMSFD